MSMTESTFTLPGTTVLGRLNARLDDAVPKLADLDAYYRGVQPLAYLAPEVQKLVGNRLKPLSVNWGRLVVGAVEERLELTGFRLGPDEPADTELWRIWQANNLDEASQLGHTEALALGRSYAVVWAGPDPAVPRITVESARQVTVERDPATGQVTAALKRWTDRGKARGVLFEPTRIRRLVSLANVVDGSTIPADGWATVDELENPLGVVPVVPLVNRPGLLTPDGESELADLLPLLDALNKLSTDLMVSSEFHAMPRRWATGIDLRVSSHGGGRTPEQARAQVEEAWSPQPGRTWLAEAPDARLGQFPESNLEGFLGAIRTLSHALASLAGLPPHYIALSATDNPASADAIRSAEASLVAKVRRRQRAFGGSWEQVMRLAVAVRDGIAPAGMAGMEAVWADPETQTVAQAADAAVKLFAAGIITREQALEDLGYTPNQIANQTVGVA